MKIAISSVVVVCTLFSLIGYSNRTEVEVLRPIQAAELKPMRQSWRGTLPCADREGVETSLFLEKDGTWVIGKCYQGVRDESSLLASYGTWTRTVDKPVLTDSKDERSYYRTKGEALETFDREGDLIKSQSNCMLQPVSASLSMAPMPV